MDQFIQTAKALSDPNRVRALMALRNQELCVCRLIELLQLAPSTVSKHLTLLREAGLIEGRKEGRWMHYRLPDLKNKKTWALLECVFKALEGSAQIETDAARLSGIIETDITELTRIYQKQGG